MEGAYALDCEMSSSIPGVVYVPSNICLMSPFSELHHHPPGSPLLFPFPCLSSVLKIDRILHSKYLLRIHFSHPLANSISWLQSRKGWKGLKTSPLADLTSWVELRDLWGEWKYGVAFPLPETCEYLLTTRRMQSSPWGAVGKALPHPASVYPLFPCFIRDKSQTW